ncbi:MAG: response regulator transcription factor [Solirubrobacterales bacterium]|nr:response regulator transcription factor [Solirubrobacterales bacterium]
MPIRVLLCDDVEPFRALVRAQLAEDPAIEVVGEAGDGDEGVERATDLQPDVVLLDLTMPGCDGLTAIPRLRRFAPRASIVALSALEARLMAEDVLGRGASKYLEKGADAAAIRAAIHEAYAG